jgi:hypothetical protein
VKAYGGVPVIDRSNPHPERSSDAINSETFKLKLYLFYRKKTTSSRQFYIKISIPLQKRESITKGCYALLAKVNLYTRTGKKLWIIISWFFWIFIGYPGIASMFRLAGERCWVYFRNCTRNGYCANKRCKDILHSGARGAGGMGMGF